MGHDWDHFMVNMFNTFRATVCSSLCFCFLFLINQILVCSIFASASHLVIIFGDKSFGLRSLVLVSAPQVKCFCWRTCSTMKIWTNILLIQGLQNVQPELQRVASFQSLSLYKCFYIPLLKDDTLVFVPESDIQTFTPDDRLSESSKWSVSRDVLFAFWNVAILCWTPPP